MTQVIESKKGNLLNFISRELVSTKVKERSSKYTIRFDHKIMAEMWHIFMLRDENSSSFCWYRASSTLRKYFLHVVVRRESSMTKKKRIETNKFFIYSHLSPKKKEEEKKVNTNIKPNEGNIANKFEMENLSIMSTVFSMRFITQKLIFQPTLRVSKNEKKLNFANWFVSRDEALDSLTYRISCSPSNEPLPFVHLSAGI